MDILQGAPFARTLPPVPEVGKVFALKLSGREYGCVMDQCNPDGSEARAEYRVYGGLFYAAETVKHFTLLGHAPHQDGTFNFSQFRPETIGRVGAQWLAAFAATFAPSPDIDYYVGAAAVEWSLSRPPKWWQFRKKARSGFSAIYVPLGPNVQRLRWKHLTPATTTDINTWQWRWLAEIK